jgi:thioredoxin reductase (NADPH)
MIDAPPMHYQVVIIGSGPAGLTAALYASRAELKPLVIEGPTPQGQLMGTTVVENWPGDISVMGPELMERMRKQAQHVGATFLDGTVTDIDTSKRPFVMSADDKKITADAIIIATGATPRHLGCPGESEYWGKGVSSCAVCDGILYRNKEVVIVGGGDTAMEHALTLIKFAKKVTIVHIRDKLAASAAMQASVIHHAKVTICYNETVTAISGDGTKVTKVALTNQQTGKQSILSVDGVFIAIGLLPNSKFLPKEIERDQKGYVRTFEHTQTSVNGIFAAGDVVDARYRQAVTSAGDGCRAALDAERYLHHKK